MSPGATKNSKMNNQEVLRFQFDNLPSDVLEEIFGHVGSVKALANLRSTCRKFTNVIDSINERSVANSLPKSRVNKLRIWRPLDDTYPQNMAKFDFHYTLRSAPKLGLKSRLKRFFHFKDYSAKGFLQYAKYDFNYSNPNVPLKKLMSHMLLTNSEQQHSELHLGDGLALDCQLLNSLIAVGPKFVGKCETLKIEIPREFDVTKLICDIDSCIGIALTKLISMIRPKRLHLTEGDHPRKFDSITQKRNYDWMVHKLVGICVENLESVNQIFVNFCSCLLPCITDNRLLPLASKNNSKIDIMAGNTNITGYGIFRLTDAWQNSAQSVERSPPLRWHFRENDTYGLGKHEEFYSALMLSRDLPVLQDRNSFAGSYFKNCYFQVENYSDPDIKLQVFADFFNES